MTERKTISRFINELVEEGITEVNWESIGGYLQFFKGDVNNRMMLFQVRLDDLFDENANHFEDDLP